MFIGEDLICLSKIKVFMVLMLVAFVLWGSLVIQLVQIAVYAVILYKSFFNTDSISKSIFSAN